MPDEVHAAHWASNRLPRFHSGQAVVDPWTGDAVTIDNGLVELVRGMWSAGIRTVASCQNVAEFAERSGLRAPAAQRRAIAERSAYV